MSTTSARMLPDDLSHKQNGETQITPMDISPGSRKTSPNKSHLKLQIMSPNMIKTEVHSPHQTPDLITEVSTVSPREAEAQPLQFVHTSSDTDAASGIFRQMLMSSSTPTSVNPQGSSSSITIKTQISPVSQQQQQHFFYNAASQATPPKVIAMETGSSQHANPANQHTPTSGFPGHMVQSGRPYFEMPYEMHNNAMPYPTDLSQSPSPPPPPRIYKPCVVCNDKSSGYHYGVSSCEGCKGFFRRSVQKNMQYTCHKDKACVINKVTRNRCQFCRLAKCFDKGMSKEAVRNDRNKKRKPKQEVCITSPVSEELSAQEQEMVDLIVQAHEDTFPLLTEDNKSFVTPEQDIMEGYLWERVSELSTQGITRIISFGKKVPLFSTLSTNDQITLLKAACLEILVLRLASRYDESEDTMSFSNGLTLTRAQMQKGGFGSLTDTVFKFAKSLVEIDCDTQEYALLSAVCLLSGDRSGLEDTEKVESLQEPVLEALKHYVRKRRTGQPHSFAKLILKLTDLRSISVKGAEEVLSLKSPERVPPLFRDMLFQEGSRAFESTDSSSIPPLMHEMLDRQENVDIEKVHDDRMLNKIFKQNPTL